MITQKDLRKNLSTQSRIIIGDIHGEYKTLLALVAKLPPGIPLTFVGDLIDRGSQSREVVNFVIENGHDCVQGNHEQMMVEHMDGTTEYQGSWANPFTQNGGLNTLYSYEKFPEDLKFHTDWMRGLPLFIEYPELVKDGRHLVVSHSSIGKVWKWSEEHRKVHQKQFEDVVRWGRDTPQDAPKIYNIFGHTPQEEPRIKSFYANVDTGACFTGREKYGVMTALQFPEMIVYQQETIRE